MSELRGNADKLKAAIQRARNDGDTWESISRECLLPVYVVRVIAGETRGNVPAPRPN